MKKTWLIGAVAAVAAGAILAVSQPAINSALADTASNTTKIVKEKVVFWEGHRGGGPGKFGGFGGFGFSLKGSVLENISDLLGMKPADVTKQQESGKSLLDIAKTKGISEDKLIATVKDTLYKNIDEKVEAGFLTAAEAKEVKAKLTDANIKEDLSRVGPKGDMGFGKGFGKRMGGKMGFGMKGDSMDAVSTLLGLKEADLREQLMNGKSLLDIAKTKGVSEQKLIDTLKAPMIKKIDELVTAGKLTADQAKEIKSKLDAHIKDDISRVHSDDGPGGHHGGPGFGDGF